MTTRVDEQLSQRALAHARTHRLDKAIREAHILVCTGAGGVGKTTTAAALGLAGARAGRRTLVLTIDPARRLAQAMGLEHLGNEPQTVKLRRSKGELAAMMLDMQTTFDELVDENARSPQQAATIKANRIYRTLSSTLSGTQEYMAMEKLHALHRQRVWELIVVDTPPTRSALDFLDAPRRMTNFLEGRLLRLLLKPGLLAGKGSMRAISFGTNAFMRVASRVTGVEVLEDLADFFRSFEGMYEGFKQRADQVLHLLQQSTSRFVVVASPEPPPLREARFFLERLQQEGLHTAAVVINRIHPECPGCPDDDELWGAIRAQRKDREGRAVAGALRLLVDAKNLGARERRDVAAALYGLRPPALIEVPMLRSDVHDLSGLEQVAAALV